MQDIVGIDREGDDGVVTRGRQVAVEPHVERGGAGIAVARQARQRQRGQAHALAGHRCVGGVAFLRRARGPGQGHSGRLGRVGRGDGAAAGFPDACQLGRLGGYRGSGGRAQGRRHGGRARDFQQQALRRAPGLDRVVAAQSIELALVAILRAHLHFQRAVRAVVDQQDGSVGAERPVGHRVAGAIELRAKQRQALVRIDRANGFPDHRVARGGDHVQRLFAGRRQVHGVAELDLHLARLQRFGAHHVVAHFVAL
jgi:hypothetical protein